MRAMLAPLSVVAAARHGPCVGRRGGFGAPPLRFACASKLRFVAWLSPSAFAAARQNRRTARANLECRYSLPARVGGGRGPRMVTNSSALVGWMPIVESNCALVALHLIATARPWTIS